MDGEIQIVIATIAFGLGINKPNVRFIIHFQSAKGLNEYIQETGRAGRDGLPAECFMLFTGNDFASQYFLVDHESSKCSKEKIEQK